MVHLGRVQWARHRQSPAPRAAYRPCPERRSDLPSAVQSIPRQSRAAGSHTSPGSKNRCHKESVSRIGVHPKVETSKLVTVLRKENRYGRKGRVFPLDYKLTVVRRWNAGESVSAMAGQGVGDPAEGACTNGRTGIGSWGRRDCVLRGLLHKLSLENRYYGHWRLTELVQRQGWAVNRKRVLRLMREDNLLCLRKRAFVPATTDSRHSWRVWPNTARGLVTTAINQLWVADITYIRWHEEFVYLAVVLDANSRRVIGWTLARDLGAGLTLAALKMALAARKPPPGVIHHSDRGVQYCCQDYIDLLVLHQLQPSMSRVANPYDNAKAESFMKTL